MAMLFNYTLDESSIGTVLPVPDGFLTELRRTQAPPPGAGEMPQWDSGRMRWKAGRFALKASGDFQHLVSLALTDIVPSGVWAQGASIQYRGDLEVVCVPRGSIWSLTLTDTPVVRPPRDSDKANYGSYPDWRHGVRPRPREAV
jgi:hypothetical protein